MSFEFCSHEPRRKKRRLDLCNSPSDVSLLEHEQLQLRGVFETTDNRTVFSNPCGSPAGGKYFDFAAEYDTTDNRLLSAQSVLGRTYYPTLKPTNHCDVAEEQNVQGDVNLSQTTDTVLTDIQVVPAIKTPCPTSHAQTQPQAPSDKCDNVQCTDYTAMAKSASSQPAVVGTKNEYDIKELIVTGYIRHVIFVLLSGDEESDDDEVDASKSVMTIIPSDVIKLVEQYYEANMIMFIIQSCFNQAFLNGIECINLNCKKVIKFKIMALDNTERITTLDQHWFDKTVSTIYLPHITIPKQAHSNYGEILQSIQQPSIILKCNLNSWREEHRASMIIFDNRLLNNWSFSNNQNARSREYKLITDLDENTKEIDAFEMDLPVMDSGSTRRTQLKSFVYSHDHGLVAVKTDGAFYRLKFNEDTDGDEDDEKKAATQTAWKWITLDTQHMPRRRNIVGLTVMDSPSLEYGKYEKLLVLTQHGEQTYREGDHKVKSANYEVGYYDPMDASYNKRASFTVRSEPLKVSYWYSTYAPPPKTEHKGHYWVLPSLHYNKTHKKVFIGGDDSKHIEAWDVIANKWMFLPKTQYTHLKGCSLWSLADQSDDLLYIDKGVESSKQDNLIEFFDLRSNERAWRVSEHYMQWDQIKDKQNEKRFDYHVYRRPFI